MTLNVKSEVFAKVKLTKTMMIKATDYWCSRLCHAWIKSCNRDALSSERKKLYYKKFAEHARLKDYFLEDLTAGIVKDIPMKLVVMTDIYHWEKVESDEDEVPVERKKVTFNCEIESVSFHEERFHIVVLNKQYFVLHLKDTFIENQESR